MVDPRLVQYITAQKQAGYSDAQIRQALLNTGYQQQVVDDAFAGATKSANATNSTSTNDPIPSAAREEADKFARQGLSALQTYAQLQQRGFDAKLAKGAVREVYGKTSIPIDHHPARIVFAVMTIIVIIAGIYIITGQKERASPSTGKIAYTSVAEQLDTVMGVARDKGSASAIKECELRFRNDDRDLCYLDVAIAVIDKTPDDTICDKIVDVKMRDTCLMNFLETDKFDSVCAKMQLADNKDTCNRLKAYSNIGSAT